ncbi:hypothetical protein NQ318_013807 [Aromia moschata]|uniref:RNase H type-1 domain-containing protein n=1 Tax=Aromia moschata TaxID=1265417 RepID=A0AAV8ZAW1_9CUCU|nr:hypothetical protein NQ318_013807 [Aromia moschata]
MKPAVCAAGGPKGIFKTRPQPMEARRFPRRGSAGNPVTQNIPGSAQSHLVTARGREKIFEELKQNRILNMRSDRIGRDIIFHKPYRVIVPKEGEEDSHIPIQQNGTIWYTDGSKTEQSTGAGATNRDPDCEISINLGNYATVFQAEITAISACAQEMTRRSYTNKRIQIISDSQAALKALGAVEIHSRVVKDCMDSLTKLAEHNSITLKWMRGHQGHVGIERADFLAKKGAEVPLINFSKLTVFFVFQFREIVYLTEMHKITNLQMIGYGDRTRMQAQVVHLFQEKYPELPPISQGTVNKIEKKLRQRAWEPDKHMCYEVCKLSDDSGNVAPDLATLRRRDLEGAVG